MRLKRALLLSRREEDESETEDVVDVDEEEDEDVGYSVPRQKLFPVFAMSCVVQVANDSVQVMIATESARLCFIPGESDEQRPERL